MQELKEDASLPGFQPGNLGTLGGMLAHLTGVHRGNVHKKGVVVITGSSTYYDEVEYEDEDEAFFEIQPKNVADHESSSLFCSESKPNQWICLDFRARRVRLTAYAIRSCGRAPWGPEHRTPKSWVIEVSSDGAAWSEIDRRENNQDLNDRLVTKVFTVARAVECRMIRMRQTGKDHNGNDRLSFSAFEVFGVLTE